jgi:hypothetical protein
LVVGVLLAASGFGADILGEYIGPIEYKGYIVFDYPEGEDPINNIVFSVDSALAGNLIIVNVPSSWSRSYGGGALTLSGSSLGPGESVSVTVSLNKYFEDGEYPVTSVGTTTAGEVSQASGPLLVGKMYLLNFIAVASAYRLPLAGFVVALGSRELFLLNRMRDPMDEIWLLLKKLKKIEEKKTGPEKELKKYKKLIDELEDRITGDERLYEDIEDGQDGSEWGSATYGTKLKKEISRKKLRLAELKNLHRYYELKVEKLDDEIDDIKKEIERLQRQTLPPT